MDYATLLYLSATAKHEIRIPPNTWIYRLAILPDVSLAAFDFAAMPEQLFPIVPIEHDEVRLELVEHGIVKVLAGYSERTDTLVLSACGGGVDA